MQLTLLLFQVVLFCLLFPNSVCSFSLHCEATRVLRPQQPGQGRQNPFPAPLPSQRCLAAGPVSVQSALLHGCSEDTQ